MHPMPHSPDYKDFSCSAADGLILRGRMYGNDNRTRSPVICLAGLSRNCLDFHNLATYLSSEQGGSNRILAIDYRGRGFSDHDKDWQNYTIFQEAEDTISAAMAAGFQHFHVIGTSRGGLIAMLLGSMRPAALRSVILNDIGPVLEGQGLLRIRNTLAKHRSPKNWAEAEEEFVKLGQLQFPALTDAQWREEAHRIFQKKNNKLIPRYDPKLVKTLQGINFDVRLADMWPQFASLGKFPLMTIRGEYSDLLSRETLDQMSLLHPRMDMHEVNGQGHAPRLGTADLPERIAGFLKNAEPAKKQH